MTADFLEEGGDWVAPRNALDPANLTDKELERQAGRLAYNNTDEGKRLYWACIEEAKRRGLL